MKSQRPSFLPLILSCCLIAPPLIADDEPPTENGETLKTSSPHVTNKIAGEFDPALADNLVDGTTSQDIVSGLREGKTFDYQYTNANGQLVTQTIEPASGLGYGEVRHALTLSEQNGGDLQAVLDMRESGLGWGEIAQQQGTTLGAAKKLSTTTTVISENGTPNNTDEPSTENGETLKTSSPHVTNKIAGEFDPALADNLVDGTTSQDIVSGLREGKTFDYQYTNADGQLVTQTIEPASGLGYGEVRHALTLSEQNGGDLQAVLDMRESGLGWGEIAQQQGTTLGAAKKLPTTTTITSGSGSSSKTNGITSASGDSSPKINKGQSKSKNYVSASRGKGIVSASGYENSSLHANKHKYHKYSGNNSNSAGAGANASQSISHGSGIVHGGGNAYGHGAGKGKGKALGKGKH